MDFLAAGQHQIETFTFEVLDAHGGSVSRTVSLDITGTNEAPVVASTDVTGAVTEPVTPVGTLTDSGTIAFTDADLADIHSVSAVTPSSGALGSLTASVSTDTTGSGAGGLVTWNYSVAAADVDFLAAGQHQIETFTFEVLDAHGGSVSRTVSLDITGTNEAPVVASTDVTGAVTEPVTPVGTLTDSGTIAFTDADLADIHSVSAVTPSSGALGSLTASVSTDTTGSGAGGLVTWNYSVAAADVDFLAAGQHQIETFTFEVLDAHGGSVSRTVSLDITGTNDDPTISVTSTDALGAVTEGAATPTLSDTGTISFNDVDLIGGHTTSVVADSGNTLGGTLTLGAVSESTSTEPGTVGWTYEVANSAAQYLADGESATEKFTVTISDGNGGTVSQLVEVTITGINAVNHPPVAVADNVITNVFNKPVNIPVWALLANDSDPDGDPIYVQDNGMIESSDSNGTAEFFPGTGADAYVQFSLSSTEGGSFNYQALDNGGEASSLPAATVSVNLDSGFNGTPGNDILVVGLNSGAMRLVGAEGNDILIGGMGNDTLSGGVGDDMIDGSAGADLLNFSEVSTSFLFTLGAGGSGSAMVNGTDTYWNIEGVIGGSGDDSLTGNTGDNILQGGVGDDTIEGGAGVDLLSFSEVSTNFSFTLGAGGSGSATINGTDTYSNMEGVIGGSGDDSLTGNTGDNILQGGVGSDLLAGGDGGDIFDYNTLSDAGDTITDFDKAEGDKLDLHDLLRTISGYDGSNPAAYVRVIDELDNTGNTTGNALVQVSSDGDPLSFETLATLDGVVRVHSISATSYSDAPILRSRLRPCGLSRTSLKFLHRVFHGHEHRALVGGRPDDFLEHHHAGAAADDERVAGVGQDAPLHRVAHVEEIVDPVLAHQVGVHQALAVDRLGAHELEMRRVVGGPVDGHLDELGLFAEAGGLLQLDHVAAPRVIRRVVVAHQAAVVDEAVLEEQLDRMRATGPTTASGSRGHSARSAS